MKSVICPIKWIVAIAGFIFYVLVIRLMLIVPIFSYYVISAMHKNLFGVISKKMTGESFGFDKSIERTVDNLDTFGKKLDLFESKLKEHWIKIVEDC